MVITDYLERNARLYGENTALVEIDYTINNDGTRSRREISWREFDNLANRFANLLTDRAERGSKVGLLMTNCLEWLPFYFGILKAGCIAVPINFRSTAEEIRYDVNLADVEVFLFGSEFTARIDTIRGGLHNVKLMLFLGEGKPEYAEDVSQLIREYPETSPSLRISEEDHAAIYFSSGTTGFPKAILHRHKALLYAGICEQKHHGQTSEDVFLCIPPLYHTGAKMHWFGSLLSAGKAVLLRGTRPEWILDAASGEQCSIVWLLVPWAQDILDAIDSGSIDIGGYDLDRLRLMHIGAQPVPPSLVERWLRHFPRHQYDTNYGLSESAGPGCVHLGIENINKVGAIGKAGYMWEAMIADEDRNALPAGTVGELAVKGPGVMLCYYKNPDATQEVIHNGWLYTGDMARMDEDGFIYLVDRKKDLIISGGENIYPVQIEDFLRRNDKIKDAAVIGIPDDRMGEKAAAIIELKEGMSCTQTEIEEFCRVLPRYKRPRKIIFDSVPRNPTGKIEKPLLREKYRSMDG